MSKSCETMRDPGRSFSSCGMSRTLSSGSRYSVTTVAGWRSTEKTFARRIDASAPTPSRFTFARASLTRSGSRSKPIAFAPSFFAAVTTMRPSPHPRS